MIIGIHWHYLVFSPKMICLPRICSFIQNDTLGCNAVSWAPFSALGSLLEDGRSIKRLVTGSCDNTVRIWRQLQQDGPWEEEHKYHNPHTGSATE